MADTKISALTGYTSPIGTDVFPIVDVTTSTTKKILVADLDTYFSGTVKTLTNKTFVAPVLGAATATSINGFTFSTPTTAGFTFAAGKVLNMQDNLTVNTSTLFFGNAKTMTFSNSLTLAGTDSTVMTFPTTSATIARTDAANTFTGTQTIGALVATTVNGNTFTTGTGILTIAASKTATHNATTTFAGTDGKTLTISNSITLAGTDSTVMTFPSTSATIARTDAAQTFTGIQTIPQILCADNAIAASGNAATVTRSNRNNVVTNNSAAGITITLSTSGATAGDMILVQSLPSSNVAQTITWVNTENSDVTPSANLNASTTSPRSDGFKWNPLTSKWRCMGSA